MIRAERHVEAEMDVCGGITVFLSLILTCICALMGGLFESARAAGSGWYMQMALNSSLDSLMSCYHREIWDKYRIFVLECADKERLAAEMEPQMETYLAAAPFYPVSGGKAQIEAMDAITGHNGDFFAKEVTDYMKVGVWTLESEESELPEMEKRMTEARAVHGIAEGYQENGRKVLRLEESIEAIGACLQKQEKHLEEMEAAVSQADGSSFFQSAESLEKELKQIPGLVAAYEKQADRLAKELQGSEQGAQEAQPDLEEGSWGMVQEEMRGYRSYLDADGARRQEVKKTEETAQGNEEVVAEAVRKGKEIQDYIDDWEPDDEDDELDEEARAGSDDHSGFSEGWTFPGSGSPRQEKNECAGSSQPPVGDGSAESLCAGGNCDFRKLDFDRGISVGVVCRRRERKAGDDWGCLDSGA